MISQGCAHACVRVSDAIEPAAAWPTGFYTGIFAGGGRTSGVRGCAHKSFLTTPTMS